MFLIDGDILIYKAVSSAEQELEWEPDLWTLVTNLDDAKDAFLSLLNPLLTEVDNPSYHLCLSDSKNWRKEIYPDYKANRKKLRKPMGFTAFRQWVIDNYSTIIKPSLEADDVMGILATKPGNDAIIWSIDKDLMQIPGKHLTADGIINVSIYEADYRHLQQTLTGDAVDGYPGCPGIGPKKADKILEDEIAKEYPWAAVEGVYLKAGLTKEYALTQARIARILRWNDWDRINQKVILWNP